MNIKLELTADGVNQVLIALHQLGASVQALAAEIHRQGSAQLVPPVVEVVPEQEGAGLTD